MDLRENTDDALQMVMVILLFEFTLMTATWYWRNDGYTDGAIVMAIGALLALRLLLFEPVGLWTDREGNESA